MTEPADRREFLLRSLEDLEREHAAGDLDDADYRDLKDDYTARAAAALRADDATLPPAPAVRSRGRLLWAGAGLVAFAALAGVLVAQASGRRDPGEVASGGLRESVTQTLNEAQERFAEGDGEGAIALFDEVLEDQPTNAEALTYKGWAQYLLLEDDEAALFTLIDAATAQPDYPDVHVFLAVVLFRGGLVEQAARQLELLDDLSPPPALLQLTEELQEEVDAALADRSTTTTASG